MNDGARKCLNSLGYSSYSTEVEYGIVFESGRVFFTSGWEEITTLENSIKHNDLIGGSYSPEGGPDLMNVRIRYEKIETILDLRTDTDIGE